MAKTARSQDQNGYLLIKGCPISTFGIFQYSAAQVGIKDGDPNRIVNVFRPESAVSDPEYINSFQVVPFINDHEMLSGFQNDNTATAPEDYGVDGVLFNVGWGAPWTRGDIKIFSRSAQADLDAGKKDLSLGYTCDFVMEKGTFDGVDYEVIQINMRGNHIALVDVGRVPGARVLDGRSLCFDSLSFSSFSTNGGAIMPQARRTMDSNTVQALKEQLKALLPTFEQFLNEEATEPAHQGGAEGGAGAEAGAANAAAGGEANSAATAAGGEGGETGTGEVAAAQPNGGEGAAEAGGAAAAGGTASTPETTEGEEDGNGTAGAPAAATGGEAAGGEGGNDPLAALKQIADICSKLMAGMSGAEGGAGGQDEGAENGEATTQADTVKGLEGTAREGADEGAAGIGENGQGTASAGPAAGKHTGADAALRGFYADAARKNRLYERLTRVVGTFDGAMDVASATSADVAAYGVRKLGIKCAKGTEMIALDAALSGIEAARKVNEATTTNKRTSDAAASAVPAIDAYFKE